MLCKMLRKIFVQLTFGFGKRWCGDCEAQLEGGCERILVGGNSVVFIRRLIFSRFSSNLLIFGFHNQRRRERQQNTTEAIAIAGLAVIAVLTVAAVGLVVCGAVYDDISPRRLGSLVMLRRREWIFQFFVEHS